MKECLSSKHNLNIWIDKVQIKSRNEPDMKEVMLRGIDDSTCFVCFIDRPYYDKVNNPGGNKGGCYLEFSYAARARHLGMDYMIPVVTDEVMLRDSYGPWEALIGGIGERGGEGQLVSHLCIYVSPLQYIDGSSN